MTITLMPIKITIKYMKPTELFKNYIQYYSIKNLSHLIPPYLKIKLY
jgi:hypothetical protein